MVGHSCCTASVLPVCRRPDRAYAVEYDEPVLLLLSIMNIWYRQGSLQHIEPNVSLTTGPVGCHS